MFVMKLPRAGNIVQTAMIAPATMRQVMPALGNLYYLQGTL